MRGMLATKDDNNSNNHNNNSSMAYRKNGKTKTQNKFIYKFYTEFKSADFGVEDGSENDDQTVSKRRKNALKQRQMQLPMRPKVDCLATKKVASHRAPFFQARAIRLISSTWRAIRRCMQRDGQKQLRK